MAQHNSYEILSHIMWLCFFRISSLMIELTCAILIFACQLSTSLDCRMLLNGLIRDGNWKFIYVWCNQWIHYVDASLAWSPMYVLEVLHPSCERLFWWSCSLCWDVIFCWWTKISFDSYEYQGNVIFLLEKKTSLTVAMKGGFPILL